MKEMGLSTEQMEKIGALLKSDDFASVQQGIELVETLIDKEQDFVDFLESMGSHTLTEYTLYDINDIFENVRNSRNRKHLSVWALVTLIQWNGRVLGMTSLSLFSHQLTRVPEAICKLTNLTKLDLGYNQLTMLPENIGNLTMLTEIDLGRNALTMLPESIGNLTKLTSMNVGGNPLESLPTNISVLTLSQSQFDNVENQLYMMNRLTSMFLYVDQFSDKIKRLPSLTKLELYSSSLTILPESIGDLT
ncbi:MAG: hypothetical protein CL916_07945, partial [Deltaproteobacteria bacterium]|nr:hypothetical protein [Deltaproteobacteria bacterium]